MVVNRFPITITVEKKTKQYLKILKTRKKIPKSQAMETAFLEWLEKEHPNLLSELILAD